MDYTNIDAELCGVAKKLSQLPCLPKNLDSERERFFKDTSYNPHFTYDIDKRPLLKAKQDLEKINIPDTSIGQLFQKKREELLTIISMMLNIGTRGFSEHSLTLYGQPNDELVDRAWKLIRLHDAEETMYVSSQTAIVHLTHAMKRYGCSWDVREKDMAARACVDLSNTCLLIKKDSFFTKKFIARLIVHEIGTHIVRYENGTHQPYQIFSHGFSGYLGTEEGLAVLNEELNNCLTRATIKTYAARVIAVHKGLQCTFRETYNYLMPYVGKENAFEVTLRVKRGIGNTLYPGAFTKDHLYLDGYFKVKRYMQRGGELRRLYYGKIGLEDLAAVEKIPGLVNPLFLSNMKHYTKQINYK